MRERERERGRRGEGGREGEYVCVHVACACVYVYAWLPMRVETRGQPQGSFLMCHEPVSGDSVSHWPGTHQVG